MIDINKPLRTVQGYKAWVAEGPNGYLFGYYTIGKDAYVPGSWDKNGHPLGSTSLTLENEPVVYFEYWVNFYHNMAGKTFLSLEAANEADQTNIRISRVHVKVISNSQGSKETLVEFVP